MELTGHDGKTCSVLKKKIYPGILVLHDYDLWTFVLKAFSNCWYGTFSITLWSVHQRGGAPAVRFVVLG